MTSPVTLSSATGDAPSIPHPSNGTSPAGPPTPQAPSEADPPGRKAEDLCTDQDPGRVSREQGLRARAAALAAELPPLTSSQAATVARIAARLDASHSQGPAESASQHDDAAAAPDPVR
jgi:hypothetical protein